MKIDARSQPAPATSEWDQPHVLVVEDDPLARRLLRHTLSSAGFEVSIAKDGGEALRMIVTTVPDLLVLDFEMPGLDGAEVCARLRADPRPEVSGLPVLMLTAHCAESDELRCLESGASDFVNKPVSRSILVARIRTQLRLRLLSEKLRLQNEEMARWRAAQEADLNAAKATQSAILPLQLPEMPGWSIETLYQPLIQVGGDIYGWRQAADGAWFFWLADATGHGAAAALFTTLAALLFDHTSSSLFSPAAVLKRVNEKFYAVFDGRSMMTACALLVTPDGKLQFASAGHPPLLIHRADGRVEALPVGATMVGIHPTMELADTEALLAPGETVLLYTDGLYALTEPDGDRMEDAAVRKAFATISFKDGIFPSLPGAIVAQSNGKPFFDDVSAISLRRNPA